MTKTKKSIFVISRGHARYTVDDQGKVVWVTGTHHGMQTEFARRSDAEAVIASYSATSRVKMSILEISFQNGSWRTTRAR